MALCQHVEEGLSIVRQHVSSREMRTAGNHSTIDSGEVQAHYMILSVKHIMLCHATSLGSLKYTSPEPLVNGNHSIRPPSNPALDYLIWATASARPSIPTPLQSLPIEIQDVILNYVSIGTVIAAKIGCLLDLESLSYGKMAH